MDKAKLISIAEHAGLLAAVTIATYLVDHVADLGLGGYAALAVAVATPLRVVRRLAGVEATVPVVASEKK